MEITLSPEQPDDLPPVAEHQPVEFACAAAAGARLALSVDGLLLDAFLRPGETTWRWRWNPGPAVGLHRLALVEELPDRSETISTWSLRVVTRKIDQERYEALLEDIQRAAYGVLSTLAATGAEGAELQREAPWRHSPAEEYYALFEERLDTFGRAVRRIAARPREQLRGVHEQEPLDRAAGLTPGSLAGLARGPFDEAPPGVAPELQEALRPGGGLLPRTIAAERGRATADSYEHRLLKHVLTLLLRRARFVGALAEREAARLGANETFVGPSARRLRAEQIAAGCAQAARTLRELRALPFLAEVHPLQAFRGVTPLLQRDAAYREVYRMWQALRQHPYIAFESPLFAIPIADLPQLYESWCAIQVARALLELGGAVREQRLVEPRRPADDEDDLDMAVVLVEHVPLLVIERGVWTLTLRYQPRYRPLRLEARGLRLAEEENLQASSPKPQAPRLGARGLRLAEQENLQASSPKPQAPRLGARGLRLAEQETLQASSPRPQAPRLGSLDRHTRVPDLAIEVQRSGEPPQALLLDAKYRLDADGRGVPQDALADAYAYLGAIGQAGRRATIGALLLYPGAGAPERYPSGVGTIPLLPGRAEALAELLAGWLSLPVA